MDTRAIRASSEDLKGGMRGAQFPADLAMYARNVWPTAIIFRIRHGNPRGGDGFVRDQARLPTQLSGS